MRPAAQRHVRQAMRRSRDMNSSQPTASKNTPSTVDIAAYADALAAVISTAGVLDPVHLRALYRVFAALQAPPAIRRAALWRAFETHEDVESLPVPSDREAQQALEPSRAPYDASRHALSFFCS